MDDSSGKMRANMERVLRAMDVIPPLGSGGRPADRNESRVPSDAYSSQPTPDPISPDPPEETGAIPQFDLGEKILAEQRRLTATRRKAPGTAEGPSDVPARPVHISTEALLQSPQAKQMIELQRIVADIVARDIACLCKGPTPVAAMEKGYGATRSPFQK